MHVSPAEGSPPAGSPALGSHAGAGRPASSGCGSLAAVAAELVAYGRELEAAGTAQADGDFTDIPEADALIKSSPEAFLIGVLFTQGVRYERAWAGPWLLSRRLGHLDLRLLAADVEVVDEALGRPPALHRFRHTLPRWISSAARRLLDEYSGDASGIWAPGNSLAEVMRRLSAFEGIGPKKAAMAAELLVRYFGVPLEGLEDGTVAYDVHVRRVFLRSGLVEADTPAEVARAAAVACPASPGTLDLPAWTVGRHSCRPTRPACETCRLTHVCPRRVWLDAEGVGRRQARRKARG